MKCMGTVDHRGIDFNRCQSEFLWRPGRTELTVGLAGSRLTVRKDIYSGCQPSTDNSQPPAAEHLLVLIGMLLTSSADLRDLCKQRPIPTGCHGSLSISLA